MSVLSISLSGPVRHRTRYGVAARLVRVASASGKPVPGDARPLTVPLAGPVRTEVDPGYWTVEAYFPAGKTVERQVLVPDGSGGEDIQLVIVTPDDEASDELAGYGTDFTYPSAGGMFSTLADDLGESDEARFAARYLETACTRSEWVDVLDAADRTVPMGPYVKEGGRYLVKPRDGERCRAWLEVHHDDDRVLVSVPGGGSGRNWSVLVSEPNEDETTVHLADERAGPLLNYLASGRIDAAGWLVGRIEEEVMEAGGSGDFASAALEVLGGPLQACVVAYAVTKCRGVSAWDDVVDSLAKEEWLPDCAILAGRAALFDGSGEVGWRKAAACFDEAIDRGVPFYAMGLDYLAEGLAILAGFDERSETNLKLVQGLARRALPKETITTIRPRQGTA